MEKTVALLNIEHLCKMLSDGVDEATRHTLLRLLAAEEATLAQLTNRPGESSNRSRQIVRQTARRQMQGKIVGAATAPVLDDPLKIAGDIYDAMCARYPNRLIILCDESGHTVARNDRVEELAENN